MMDRTAKPEELLREAKAEELLRELGWRARLVVYVASAPGSGKTRRLLEDARRLAADGKRVVIGWVETKGRPDLERMAAALPRLPSRKVQIGERVFEDFDYDAALREKPDVVILDELAHDNLGDAPNAKRWQDALALKEHGIGVIGAFNIQHLENVAPAVEALIGYPVREIIPLSFLQAADEVVALDVSPSLLQSRVKAGKIVNEQDIDRALNGIFKEQTLYMLRELLLRTVDSLTLPVVRAGRTSMAAAFVYPNVDEVHYLKRTAAIAGALDLGLEVVPVQGVDRTSLERVTRELGAEMLHGTFDPAGMPGDTLHASLVALPNGRIAAKLANAPLPYDLFIVGAGQTYLGANPARSPYSHTAGDRLRVGYGKLTVYIGAAAGAGKTYAMLDRAHQLRADGIDVVIGFVETHGRKETAALLDGLEIIPPKVVNANGITYREFDRDALIARKPQVALIDELAHTNAPGSIAPKRFYDVLAVLRAGIDVMTTLNVQHLEGLSDTILRLTGTVVRETLPDGILTLADEVILIDVTPETLRQRLREGKIYPPDRCDAALANFFRTENLFALRELALREALRARQRTRIASPFERILLSVGSREIDASMISRASRIAARLAIDFAIAHVVRPRSLPEATLVEKMRAEARKTNAEWIDEIADDVPQRLLEIARSRRETTIALAGTRRTPRLLQRPSFARRLLDAGARELLVLTPTNGSAPSAPPEE
jgi:two-component system, OmpR family, sensor histidine kinase KdpD